MSAQASTRRSILGHHGGGVTALLLLLPMFWCTPSARAQGDMTLTAEQVKAAFLYNFTKYTAWPNAARAEHRVLCICVLQAREVATELERSVAGRLSADRIIRVQRMSDATEVDGCDVVFAGDTTRADERKLFAALGSKAVLTVGDSPDFLEGGMIRFVLQGDRLRFDVNLVAARKVNIRLDSRLVVLARNRIEVAP